MLWKPDPAIFGQHRVDSRLLLEHLETLACAYPGLRIEYADMSTGASADILSRSGFLDLLVRRNKERHLPYPAISIQVEAGDVKFDIAFLHGGDSMIRSYVNAEPTTDGSHVQGFLRGLAASVSQQAKKRGLASVDLIDSRLVLRGLSAEISVVADRPQYESPTKSVLHHPEIDRHVAQQVNARLTEILNEHPSLAEQLIATVMCPERTG